MARKKQNICLRIQHCVQKPCSQTAPQNFCFRSDASISAEYAVARQKSPHLKIASSP